MRLAPIFPRPWPEFPSQKHAASESARGIPAPPNPSVQGRISACPVREPERLAPKTNQFRRTLPDDPGEGHAIKTAGRRGGRRVQIRVPIEPKQTELLVVTARPGQHRQDLRAVSPEHN